MSGTQGSTTLHTMWCHSVLDEVALLVLPRHDCLAVVVVGLLRLLCRQPVGGAGRQGVVVVRKQCLSGAGELVACCQQRVHAAISMCACVCV